MSPTTAVRFMPRLAACLMALTMLAGCAQVAAISEVLFPVSIEDERTLGLQIREQIDQEMDIVTDPAVVNYVRSIGQRLWQNTPQGPIEPRFHVVGEESINAFAIPGGDIYIHTGLIEAADDEAELASVIAHEIGHVIHRHGVAQVSRQMGLQFIQQAVLGDTGPAIELVSGLLRTGVMFHYSREDEFEADGVAVRALHQTGYDPMALRTFFAKLEERSPAGRMPTLFATHPPTSDRMANVERLARQLPEGRRERPTGELRRVKGRL